MIYGSLLRQCGGWWVWRSAEFRARAWRDGCYAMGGDHIERESIAVVVLDGAISTQTDLADEILNAAATIHRLNRWNRKLAEQMKRV